MPAKNTISGTEERDLIRVAQQRLAVNPDDKIGLAARDAVVVANLRLGLTRRLKRFYESRGVECEDAVQMACIGLIRAVHDFDLNRGISFSTYAVYKILGEISRSVRRPRGGDAVLIGGRSLVGTGVERGESFGEEYTAKFWQNVPDYREEEEVEYFSFEVVRVKAVLASWPRSGRVYRYANVLRERFGLDGSPPATLEAVGRRRRISKERARQIQVRAMQKLKADYLAALRSEQSSKDTEVSCAGTRS